MLKAVIGGVSMILALVALGCAGAGGGTAGGEAEKPSAEEQNALQAVSAELDALVVWSSSRKGNHDLYLTGTKTWKLTQLTSGENVDWFPRFSPDGSTIIFTRSRKGWVYERDANKLNKWDVFTVPTAGGEASRIVDNASWGNWLGNDKIIFVRRTKVFTRELKGTEETLLVDSEQVEGLGGAHLQQPQLSPDGRYLAMTLRGPRRETGILDLETKAWVATGKGCQINWHPEGKRIYWINPSGNGGSEVFSIEVADGKPKQEYGYEEMRFVDIPGRRSHEYFPQMDQQAGWMVWGATQRGHDHDVAPYEIYIWELGASPDAITRISFHSGNDRWPDIHVNR